MSNSPENTQDEYGSFTPGTIVLAKLKSFPPWPGIVIPNELIPQGVLKSKPKLKVKASGRPTSSGRGRGRGRRKGGRRRAETPVADSANESVQDDSTNVNDDDDKLWCVRFLRDDTFMWATNKDISLLGEDQIKQFLEKNQKNKKTIKGAYEMALNPPDLEEFIIFGSDGRPIDVDNAADDEDFKEDDLIDEDEDDVDEIEEDDDDDEDDEDDEEEPVVTKKRKNPSRKPATPVKKAKRGRPASAKKAKKPVHQEPETSGDEDWEEELFGETEPIAIDIPYAKDLQFEIKSFSPLIKKFKALLLTTFSPLDKEDVQDFEISAKDIKSLNESLDQIYNDEEIPPVALVRHFGLNKVIFSILKQPILLKRKDLIKFRDRLNAFVEDLFGLVIDIDENWTYKEEEEEKIEEVLPETTDGENGETAASEADMSVVPTTKAEETSKTSEAALKVEEPIEAEETSEMKED